MGQVSNKNHNMELQSSIFARPNFALDELTILCLYVPGFQRQAFKRFKILQERLQEIKEQRKNKGSVLVADPVTMHKMHKLAS